MVVHLLEEKNIDGLTPITTTIQFLNSVEEFLPYMQAVVGSNPTGTTKIMVLTIQWNVDNSEWSKSSSPFLPRPHKTQESS